MLSAIDHNLQATKWILMCIENSNYKSLKCVRIKDTLALTIRALKIYLNSKINTPI